MIFDWQKDIEKPLEALKNGIDKITMTYGARKLDGEAHQADLKIFIDGLRKWHTKLSA